MRIKKDLYNTKFLIILSVMGLMFMNTFAFVLGFDKTLFYIMICLLIDIIILLLGIVVYVLFSLHCKSYYEINENVIKLIINGKIVKEIKNSQIIYYKYTNIFKLLLGDSSGGYLTIIYNDGKNRQQIEISLSKKMQGKLLING